MLRCILQTLVASVGLSSYLSVQGATTVFFNSTQVANPVASGVTSDTISSQGYLFQYTRDKLFTGGGSVPIGRPVRVPWPEGVEAQAVTTPPPGVTDHKAKIILRRVDGDTFDFSAFTAKLLANTAATGASIEIMPSLNGEDAWNDPLYFNASGYYGQSFSYDTSPNPWGSTSLLHGFDAYKITLFVDYAFTALTLGGALVGDFNSDLVCDINDLNAMLAIGPIAAGVTVNSANRRFDLTGDGVINNADLDEWLSIGGAANGLSAPYKRGDANLDGVVDGSDFGLWNSNKFTATLLWDNGNFDGNGVTDGSDFGLWNANKFTSSDQLSTVPEPLQCVPLMELVTGLAILGMARRVRG